MIHAKSTILLAGAAGILSTFAVPQSGINPDLELGAKGWDVPEKNFSVRDGAGRNGSKGLVWEDRDTNAYVIASYGFPFRPGQKLRVSLWIRNELQAKGNLRLEVEFFGKRGNYLNSVGFRPAPNQKAAPGDWIRYVADTGLMPPATARCRVDLAVKKGTSGRCAFDDVEIEQIGFIDDALFYTTAPGDRACEGTFRLSAVTYADMSGLKPEDCEATFVYEGPAGVCRAKADTFADGLAELQFDVSRLKVGKQRIRFEVRTKDGKVLDSRRLSFERLAAPAKAKVRFDRHRRLIVDGKPTYPLVVCISSDVEDDPLALPSLERSPFRMIQPQYSLGIRRDRLDRYHAHGFRVFVCLCEAFTSWYAPMPEVSEWWDELACVAANIDAFRDHPALLGWYLADEPTPAKMPRCRERYKLARALDPEHVVLNALCHAVQARETQCSCDVVALDCYPVPRDGTEATKPANLAKVTEEMRIAANGMRGDKPLWFVPQAFAWVRDPARFPTYREMRSMVWQGIAGGADGVVFYSLGEMLSNYRKTPGYRFEEYWGITCRVAREIKDREEILLTTEPAPAISGLPKGVVARAWKLGDRTLFVAVNTTHRPVSGTVTVGGEKIDLALGGDDVLLK